MVGLANVEPSDSSTESPLHPFLVLRGVNDKDDLVLFATDIFCSNKASYRFRAAGGMGIFRRVARMGSGWGVVEWGKDEGLFGGRGGARRACAARESGFAPVLAFDVPGDCANGSSLCAGFEISSSFG